MWIKEKEVIIKGDFPIAATVTYTDENKKSLAVVIIMGTGKSDRDGNVFGFHSDLYKDLAHKFAEYGYVSARYDKRGTHRSGGKYGKTGLSDLTNDAVSVTRYLKSLQYVDENKVIICGHSEGTIIASLVSEKEETAGLVLLGGAGMCIKDALVHQNTLIAGEVTEAKGMTGAILRKTFDLDKQLAMIEDMFRKSKETVKDTVFIKGAPMPAKWLREHGSYTSEDLAEKLKHYGKPVLAITGKADFEADFHKLDALSGEKHITCFTPEKLTHILICCDGDASILNVKKLYKELIKKPLDVNMLGIIKDWLARCEL